MGEGNDRIVILKSFGFGSWNEAAFKGPANDMRGEGGWPRLRMVVWIYCVLLPGFQWGMKYAGSCNDYTESKTCLVT